MPYSFQSTSGNNILCCDLFILFMYLFIYFPSDRPGPPVGPVKFDEVTKEHMVISWKPPLDDGGSDITNYIIEKKEVGKDVWMPVTSASAKTTCKVSKLLEGKDYIFRIYAENLYGISDPLVSDSMKAKDRFSMHYLSF